MHFGTKHRNQISFKRDEKLVVLIVSLGFHLKIWLEKYILAVFSGTSKVQLLAPPTFLNSILRV